MSQQIKVYHAAHALAAADDTERNTRNLRYALRHAVEAHQGPTVTMAEVAAAGSIREARAARHAAWQGAMAYTSGFEAYAKAYALHAATEATEGAAWRGAFLALLKAYAGRVTHPDVAAGLRGAAEVPAGACLDVVALALALGGGHPTTATLRGVALASAPYAWRTAYRVASAILANRYGLL